MELALEAYRAAAQAYDAIGEKLGLANAKSGEADALLKNGEIEKTRSLYQDALVRFQKIKAIVGQMDTLRNLGVLEVRAGNEEQGRNYYRQCLTIADTKLDYQNHPEVQQWRGELNDLENL